MKWAHCFQGCEISAPGGKSAAVPSTAGILCMKASLLCSIHRSEELDISVALLSVKPEQCRLSHS